MDTKYYLDVDKDLGGYSSEVPPLPIPNREVKLANADGTAFSCGRVGSRLFKTNPERVGLFFVLTLRQSITFTYCRAVGLKEAAVPPPNIYNPPKPSFEKEGFIDQG